MIRFKYFIALLCNRRYKIVTLNSYFLQDIYSLEKHRKFLKILILLYLKTSGNFHGISLEFREFFKKILFLITVLILKAVDGDKPSYKLYMFNT